jgi:glucuronoarabinoxylan endo-1,4-beta-xylanase
MAHPAPRPVWAALAAVLLAPLAAGQTVTVEWDDVRQTIDGFGASDAWFADEMQRHPQSAAILDALFSTTSGAGLSILRQRIDPGVFEAEGVYDWQDKDWIASGWMAQQARARGVPVVWGSAWSAPKWMKTNGERSNGGFLFKDRYDDYAAWLATWAEEMEAQHGVAYDALSPQNEPGAKPWASMEWTAGGFRDFLRDHLGPEWDARGLGDVALVAPEETHWHKVDVFMDVIAADPAALAVVDVVAGHAYEYNPNSTSRPTTSYNDYGRPVWMTEWSYDVYADDVSIANGVEWALNVWSLLVKAEVSAVHHWWLFNFHDDGRQQGLVNAVDGEADFELTKRLFTIGQFSRFVRPGWVRVDATERASASVYVAAFRDPASGRFAVVAINESPAAQPVEVAFDGFTSGAVTPHQTTAARDIARAVDVEGGAGFEATLPGRSVTTFTGRGTPTGATGAASGAAPLVVGGPSPNPSGGPVEFRLDLPSAADVRLSVFDAIGRKVAGVTSGPVPAGAHAVALDTSRLAPGVYVYRVEAAGAGGLGVATGRLTVAR